MTDQPRKVVIVRLPVSLVKAVDHYAIERELRRPQAMEELLKRGVDAVIAEAEAPITGKRQ